MVKVALPAATGMELGSIRRMRWVEAAFVTPGAAWMPPQLAATSASSVSWSFMMVLSTGD
jgi:hypothetical protein